MPPRLGLPGMDAPLARTSLAARYQRGHASPEEVLPRVGADEAFLQKPFSLQALLAAVRPLADAFRGAR